MDVLQHKLTVNEIFYSIQGESYLAGLPFVFVRLTGCHQRCVYCDTEYAFKEGRKMTLQAILETISNYPCKRVLVTGGEPLLQAQTPTLMQELLHRGYHVSVETGGNRDVSGVPDGVFRIVDLKTPTSGECERNNYDNLKHLRSQDEIKFVVMNEADIKWSVEMIIRYNLDQICHVSISPTDLQLNPMIADHILKTGKSIRQQMQLHKLIWPAAQRGV